MVIYSERVDSIQYSTTVAKHVTAAIKKKHKTVLSISEETGIPRTTLTRRLASPETSPFTVVELSKIADVLNMPVARFLSNKTKSPQVPAAGNETERR